MGSDTYLVEKARNTLLPRSAKVLLGVKSGPIVSGESSMMGREYFSFTFEGYVEPFDRKAIQSFKKKCQDCPSCAESQILGAVSEISLDKKQMRVSEQKIVRRDNEKKMLYDLVEDFKILRR